MKRFTMLSALCILLTFLVSATVRTVSNFPPNVAQYNTIQAAVDASASGDTVYVHGSPNDYAVVNIDDSITILGPGWMPDKQLPFTARVQGINVTTNAARGTEIHGLDFIAALNFATGLTISNIKVIRNHFRAGITLNIPCCTVGSYSGFLIEGNWFENSYITTWTGHSLSNFIIHNNVFFDNQGHSTAVGGFMNASNILVDHNLFYGGPYGVFPSSRFLLITNNIFVRRDASGANTSTFNNNITYLTPNDAPWTVNSNTGVGNFAATNPQMADEAAVEANTNNPLLDFTISAGPGNNGGSDTKDIGLLYDATGSLNWVNSRGSRMPFIFSMNITTPTVAPGGNVSVTVESRRNN
jgi:hypothetical protein